MVPSTRGKHALALFNPWAGKRGSMNLPAMHMQCPAQIYPGGPILGNDNTIYLGKMGRGMTAAPCNRKDGSHSLPHCGWYYPPALLPFPVSFFARAPSLSLAANESTLTTRALWDLSNKVSLEASASSGLT